MNFLQKVNQKRSEIRLRKSGLVFKRTGLGQAVFTTKEEHDKNLGYVNTALWPDEWTVEQLRAAADYMENHRNCTLYSDGSGKKIRLK